VCCSVLQCVAVCCSVLQCVAVCCSVLQCVAVCCSVLQCVVACCSVGFCRSFLMDKFFFCRVSWSFVKVSFDLFEDLLRFMCRSFLFYIRVFCWSFFQGLVCRSLWMVTFSCVFWKISCHLYAGLFWSTYVSFAVVLCRSVLQVSF